jgi:hypothetical protein
MVKNEPGLTKLLAIQVNGTAPSWGHHDPACAKLVISERICRYEKVIQMNRAALVGDVMSRPSPSR